MHAMLYSPTRALWIRLYTRLRPRHQVNPWPTATPAPAPPAPTSGRRRPASGHGRWPHERHRHPPLEVRALRPTL